MSDLTDLNDTQRQLARTLRTQLRASEAVDPTISARLTGIDGLAVAALLLVLVIVLPPQFPSMSTTPASDNSIESVEVLTEDMEPEFYQDLEMLQWLAQAPEASV